MDKAKVVIRPYEPSDRAFILATWLKGQRWGNLYFNEIPQDLYFREYGAVVARLLALPGMDVVVACDEADPKWIWGFAVVRGDELYWVHVKTDYRNNGIAALLLSGRSIKTIKAFTRIGRAIAAKKGLIFNPF